MPKNNAPEKVYVAVGQQATKEMPYSEVCMHMKVAGKKLIVEPMGNGMAKLFTLDGKRFSTVTCGEAGLYSDENGFYFYPDLP